MENYQIYVKELNQLVPVSKEVYYEYYRPIWRLQKAMRNSKQCMCPQKQLWMCDGCCVDCVHHAAGNVWSLEHEQEVMGDIHADESINIEELISDKIILEQLMHCLNEICPEFIRFAELKSSGISERDIATRLGIPRKTLAYRIQKARKILLEEFF